MLRAARLLSSPLAFIATAILAWLAVGRQLAAPPGRELATFAEPRSLAPGEQHRYSLQLAAGEYVRIEVEQKGIDCVVLLTDPRGRALLTVDSPIGDLGTETLEAVAAEAGVFTLAVSAFGTPPSTGRYAARLAARRPAGDPERERARLAAVLAGAEEARQRGENQVAETQLATVLAGWERLGDPSFQAQTHERLSRAQLALGERAAGIASLEQAERLFSQTGETRARALALHQLGLALLEASEVPAAVARLRQGLPLAREAEDRDTEAFLHGALGQALSILGKMQPALDEMEAARRLWHELALPSREATLLHNLGVTRGYLGDWGPARDYLEAARELWLRLGSERRLAVTLDKLAEVERRSGHLEAARELYSQALVLRHRAGDRAGVAVTESGLAAILRDQGRVAEALPLLASARDVFHQLGDLRQEAILLQNLGLAEAAGGEPAKAGRSYQQARAIFERLGDQARLAETFSLLARSERQTGDLAAARREVEEALALAESLREEITDPRLRTAYFATLASDYELAVDLLFELGRSHPEGPFAAQAFAMSERARARALLEVLGGMERQLSPGDSPGRSLRAAACGAVPEEDVEAEVRLLERLLDPPGGRQDRSAPRPELVERLAAQRAELVRLRQCLLAADPRYAALVAPQPLAAAEIQQQVLEPGVLLLEYKLGERRSFVWAVERDRLVGFELPPRRELEALAIEAHHLLAASHRRETRPRLEAVLCAASRELLAPVAERLHGQKLVIVAEGALQYLPFAALPLLTATGGCEPDQPLLTQNEITGLPSASVLAVLRRELGGRERAARAPSPRRLALVADPVYEADDPRLPPQREPGAALASPRPEGPHPESDLARLRFAREEAEAIAVLLPSHDSSRAFGTAASKRLFLDGSLDGFRLVHVVSHGIFDAAAPERSGLVLSLFGPDGSPRDGFLSVGEVFGLRLHADLVVLSACQTALGEEVRGEGLQGLTRGLFHAGAARSLLSLWNVEDRATAELMASFYRHLLQQGMAPGAALRAAQLELRQQPEHRAPYFWAGFVLQGEWRRIELDR